MEGDFAMVYGYCRVSTQGQAKDGNSLEVQEKLLKENGAKKYIQTLLLELKHTGQNLTSFWISFSQGISWLLPNWTG